MKGLNDFEAPSSPDVDIAYMLTLGDMIEIREKLENLFDCRDDDVRRATLVEIFKLLDKADETSGWSVCRA